MTDIEKGTLDQAVRQVLERVRDPRSQQDLVTAGLVESVRIQGGLVQITLAADRAHAAGLEPARAEVERALRAVPGIMNATVVLTAHRPAGSAPAPAPARPPVPAAPAGGGGGHRPIGLGGGGPAPAATDGPPAKLLAGAKAVIAVASGKGGVGKSTTAVNLAIGLARTGLSVGLLDADIHGPSLPRMLGITHQPEVRDKRLIPIDAWGLKVMSIGLLVEERTAMIWRGPMVMGALQQLMVDVDWGELDVLVVDMPPGTGDAQLTMAQKVALAGAVIVSTPQDIALLDARRGVAMFEKTRVPVLGIVENMSTFCCPNCGHSTPLFGHGGARAEAQTLGVPFLGEVPLLLDIRVSADAGTPILASAPDSDAGRAYMAIATRVAEALRPQLEKKRAG
ncbi:Mrp/NBP35 family ATP-binding protein [Lichenicola cladoniae]|uniref:Iron-sulfur cluster carrier protein n=1 Tax=Lichenicola cladoniae TaxID=1484109 RepID=A0A6M8HS67_9PROT|nr:Mrp/NBP35 family ATP-binding protein [Lichenicola cladoniae]NPD65634.1 Mrp/NBP35 family ATP-binding protein [Acetobacteraceae bacterium]QKE91333.1 Mrp/NBP35 family ATP-binding protein [Lichenicola cladoniae]